MKNRKIARAVLYFALLIVWASLLTWIKPPRILYRNVIKRQITDESGKQVERYIQVYGNQTVRQTFIPEKKWSTITLLLGNNGETYDGSYNVKIYDDSHDILAEWKKQKFELQSAGLWITFRQCGFSAEAGKQYTIEISAPELTKENSVHVTVSSKTLYTDGQLTLPEGDSKGTLYFEVGREYINYFVIAVFFILGVLVIFWWFNRYKPIEKLAPVLILGTGICMILLMAPLSEPDDKYHYESALMLSNAVMGKKDLGSVEKEYVNYSGLMLHINVNSAFVRVLGDARHPRRANRNLTYLYRVQDGLYMPLAYMPQAIGLAIARKIHLNFSYAYYLGRLFALMAYCIMVCGAIHLMPKKKMLVLMWALFPMVLQQGTSYSYDTMINGLSLLYYAYVMKLAVGDGIEKERKVQWSHMMTAGVLLGLLSPIKFIYFLSVLALLIIPPEKFKSRRDRGLKIGLAVLIAMGMIVVTEFPTIRVLLAGGQLDADVSRYTLATILARPIESVKIILSSIDEQLWTLLQQSIGSALGGLNVFIPDLTIFGFMLLIMIALSSGGKESIQLINGQRGVLLLLCFCELVGVFVGMMIGWTQYGLKSIQGMQGRYFLPFTIPFLIAVEPRKIQSHVSNQKLIGLFWFLEISVIVAVFSQIPI